MLEESVSSLTSIWASMNSWLTPPVLFLFLNLMIGTIAITSSLATKKPNNEQHQEPQQEGQKQPLYHQPQEQNQLGRSPSVLQRLKSINFYSYRSQEPPTFTFEKPQEFDHHLAALQQDHHQRQRQLPLSRTPSLLQKLKSINPYNYLSPEPITKESIVAQQIDDDLKQGREQGAEQRVGEDEKGEENDEVIQDQEQTLDEIYSNLKSENKVSRSKSDTKPTSGEVPTKLTKKMKKSASLKSGFAHFEEDDIVEARRPATVREKKSEVMAEVDHGEVDAKAGDFINRFRQQLKLQRIDSITRYKEMVNRGSEK